MTAVEGERRGDSCGAGGARYLAKAAGGVGGSSGIRAPHQITIKRLTIANVGYWDCLSSQLQKCVKADCER